MERESRMKERTTMTKRTNIVASFLDQMEIATQEMRKDPPNTIRLLNVAVNAIHDDPDSSRWPAEIGDAVSVMNAAVIVATSPNPEKYFDVDLLDALTLLIESAGRLNRSAKRATEAGSETEEGE
jgi:hypothetical protein